MKIRSWLYLGFSVRKPNLIGRLVAFKKGNTPIADDFIIPQMFILLYIINVILILEFESTKKTIEQHSPLKFMLAILILVEPLDLRFPHKNICILLLKKLRMPQLLCKLCGVLS